MKYVDSEGSTDSRKLWKMHKFQNIDSKVGSNVGSINSRNLSPDIHHLKRKASDPYLPDVGLDR